jgi:hypothetical protein
VTVRRCAGARRALLVLTTAVALAACGSDTDNHRAADSERNAQHPGTPPPTFADDGPGEIGGSHGEATSGIGAVDRHVLSLVLGPPIWRPATGARSPSTCSARTASRGRALRSSAPSGSISSWSPRTFATSTASTREVAGTVWRARVRPEAPGDYMVIVDVNNRRRQVVTGDLRVGGEERAIQRPVAQARLQAQHLVPNRPLTLRFEAPGATEPYLGAAGHLVIICEGTLEYLHVDPHERELAFDADFPQPGAYVMFLEYKRDGEVRRDRFAVTVA